MRSFHSAKYSDIQEKNMAPANNIPYNLINNSKCNKIFNKMPKIEPDVINNLSIGHGGKLS